MYGVSVGVRDDDREEGSEHEKGKSVLVCSSSGGIYDICAFFTSRSDHDLSFLFIYSVSMQYELKVATKYPQLSGAKAETIAALFDDMWTSNGNR